MFTYFRQLIIGLLLVSPVLATASEIDTVDVYVTLDRDGTANVSEHWKVDVDSKNTEWYLVQNGMKGMQITDFKVFDNDLRSYMTDDTPWDTERSRSAKAGKSGIVYKGTDSYELCWGVGSSGKHHWTAEYKIKGFVKQYTDGCGFNHCFISDNLSSEPKYIRTTISMADNEPLSFENARIWAFRYPGTCKFVDGKIVAENTEPLSTSNSMIIMVIFPPNAFNSTNVIANDTIGTMKWRALEGSDYLKDFSESDYQAGNNVLWKQNEDKDLKWYEWIYGSILALLIVLLSILTMLGIAYVVSRGFYYSSIVFWNIISLRPLRIYLRQRKLMEGATSKYYREIPAKGNLSRAYHDLDKNNYRVFPSSKDDLFAAYAVRLMRIKAISITTTKEGDKTVERMLIAKNFDFTDLPSCPDTNAMKTLYNILRNASGTNFILEKGELKRYLISNDRQARKLLSYASAEEKRKCTPTEYQQVVGLRNFLKDFSLVNERGALEVELWDEYLVYATLFGMADKVLKDFKEYSPDYFVKSIIGAQLMDKNGHMVKDFSKFTGISAVGSRLYSTAKYSGSRSSGGGGSSSGGGGGGHSGGGGGGGR